MLDLTAADPMGAGQWSDNQVLLYGGEAVSDGLIDGPTVTGIRPSQVQFPEAGIFADTANPIRAWFATWQTSDLRMRTIPVATVSEEFWVYTDSLGTSSNFIDSLNEGAASINIVPSPGPWGCLLPLALTTAARPRRNNGCPHPLRTIAISACIAPLAHLPDFQHHIRQRLIRRNRCRRLQRRRREAQDQGPDAHHCLLRISSRGRSRVSVSGT